MNELRMKDKPTTPHRNCSANHSFT